jgi:hypothetical protein
MPTGPASASALGPQRLRIVENYTSHDQARHPPIPCATAFRIVW